MKTQPVVNLQNDPKGLLMKINEIKTYCTKTKINKVTKNLF